jgi:hypothetical protein
MRSFLVICAMVIRVVAARDGRVLAAKIAYKGDLSAQCRLVVVGVIGGRTVRGHGTCFREFRVFTLTKDLL